MNKRDSILSTFKKNDDRIFASKIIDKIEQSQVTGKIQHTDFLDPNQRALTEKIIVKILNKVSETEYTFTGGYVGAERVIAIFHPVFYCNEYSTQDNEIFDDSDALLRFIRISDSGKKKLSHRDYLGALVNLGIKREKIGDILVGDSFCDVVVASEIAEYICYNLNKVANINITVDIINKEDIIVPQQKTKEINAVVSSLRIDSVVAAGYGISRTKAAQLIKAERVSLNWEITTGVTKMVKEGDTISLKGKGRIKVDSIKGITKKGRTSIKLLRIL